MALADAAIRQSSAGMTPWQILVLRSAPVLPVMYLMARGAGSGSCRRAGLGSALWR
jgi:hypothetical protein